MLIRDVLIVGAGPSGLATAIAAKQQGLDYVLVEKGVLVDSIFHFPTHMVFFTTPELLEIGGLPLVTPYDKPTRLEGAALLPARRRHVRPPDRISRAGRCDRTRREMSCGDVGAEGAGFTVDHAGRAQTCRRVTQARAVVLAIGYYDHPNYLGVPGEDLPHVSHYYTDAAPVLPPARRHRRRQELRRRGGPGALSRGRARHAGAPPGGARRLHQVLGAARYREPDQGRVDRRALRDARHRDSTSASVVVGTRGGVARRSGRQRCSC